MNTKRFLKLLDQLNEKYSKLYPEEEYYYYISDWYVYMQSVGDPIDIVCPLDDKWYQYLTDLLNQSM